MDFVSAVKTIKAQRGVTNTFYAMLCDYGAFDEEERWVKGIVKQICESGFAIRLSGLSASNRQWKMEVSDMMYRLTSQFGYREDAVSDIFHKLCIGMGLVGASYDWVGAFQVGSPQSVSRSSVSGSSSGFSPQAAVSKASGNANGHDYVDLGLPSGTLWATCNVGASKPEDCGNYYAWGETKEKDVFNWNSYAYCDGDYKSCHNIGTNICGTNYDVAYVKKGCDWMMPNINQVMELIMNCTYEWFTLNGVHGGKFVGKNGNYIFLPAAGACYDYGLDDVGSYGCYWVGSSNYASHCGDGFGFDDHFGAYQANGSHRCVGMSVRPVRRK